MLKKPQRNVHANLRILLVTFFNNSKLIHQSSNPLLDKTKMYKLFPSACVWTSIFGGKHDSRHLKCWTAYHTYGRECLLQNGLIFYSTPPPPKLETLNKDIDTLATRLNLREYHTPDTTDDIEQQPLYRPSILEKLNQRECREYHYMPSREPYLNSYVDRLRQDIVIEISNTHRFQRDNLNKRERAALKRLSNNRGIIIKPADKGGATVIVNTKDYITEAMWQLSNEQYYKKLEKISLWIMNNWLTNILLNWSVIKT